MNKKSQIDFSVIIPTYNRSAYVPLSIKSALQQKNVKIEVLVIDDGSDDTEKVVKALKDKRIIYIKNKKRLGYAMNVKKCFFESKGKYIFTLGDDDIILNNNTLSSIKNIMDKDNFGLGKIGGFSYENDPLKPVKNFILSNKTIKLKASDGEKILLNLFDFSIGFYSGLTFRNDFVDKKKFIDHLGYAYFPLIFDLVRKHGAVYIPHHFIVARLSYDMMTTYFNIKNHGSFFMEDLFRILSKCMSTEIFQQYKKQFLLREIFLLPHIHYFSNYPNLIEVIKRIVKLDRTLLKKPKFYLFATLAFIPKPMMLIVRKIFVAQEARRTQAIAVQYNYQKKMKLLLQK